MISEPGEIKVRNRIAGILLRLNSLLVQAEKVTLCLLLFSMAGLSIWQIVLRNLSGGGISRIDLILRLSVLWIAFIGASLAFEYKRHIRIDVLYNLMKAERSQRYVSIIAELTALIVAILLFIASADYIHLAVTGNQATIFPLIPDWCFRLVIPYAFLAMAFRTGVNLLRLIMQLRSHASKGERD